MKALIISDDSNIINKFDSFFNSNGFDVIVYKWLIKALDNIEEIQPDCIIISSTEYPRHWKTLFQFLQSGLGGENITKILFTNNNLDEEEKKKADYLKTDFFIEDFSTVAFNDFEKEFQLKYNLNKKQQNDLIVQKESIDIPEPSTIGGTGLFTFSHPETNRFVTGKFFDNNGKTLTCRFDYENDFNNITIGTKIENYNYYDNNNKLNNKNVVVSNILEFNQDKLFIMELI